MWLTNTSIRRPIFIIMFVLALVVLGIKSRQQMPQELMPNIDMPYVTIFTTYSGAGPSEIETLVSEPIEKAVSAIANVKNVTSTSQTGVSVVAVEFEMGTDIESAAADVRDKVAAISAALPDDADDPKISKLDTSSMPVMRIGMEGPLSPKEMRILADDTVSDRFAKVSGVASITVLGGEEREISVSVDKRRLDAYGVGISSIVTALRASSMNVPAGNIKEGPRDYSVRTVGEFVNAEDVGKTPITLPDSTVITVNDIAKVIDTVKEPTVISRMNGKPAVTFTIQKQSGANTVAIAKGIKREIELMKPILPHGVDMIISSDTSKNVTDALDGVNSSLVEGIVLVVIIVFLFLHTVRATFIVGLAIPTSLFATFVPTGALGFTQNSMLLLALSLVVGILVDDSIVVLENIERHLKLREEPEEAAFNGRSEIGLAAIVITMVDIVTFLPIAYMGGLMGQFFHQFGITIAVATGFSLLVSFTLTPMLSSKLMKSELDKERDDRATEQRVASGRPTFKDRVDIAVGKLFDHSEHVLDNIRDAYRDILDWALKNRATTVVIGMVSLLLTLMMVMPLPPLGMLMSKAAMPRVVLALISLALLAFAFIVNPAGRKASVWIAGIVIAIALTVNFHLAVEFFPTSDQGTFTVTVRNPPGTSLQQTDVVMRKFEKIIADIPEIRTTKWKVSDAKLFNPLTWGKSHYEEQTGYYTVTSGTNSTRAMGSGDSGGQYGTIEVKLVDKKHRKRPIQDVIDDITQKTAHVAGPELVTCSISQTGAPSSGISKEVSGINMSSILAEANNVAKVMKKTPGCVDVDISYKPSAPERRIIIDKYRAAELGVTVSQISTAARTAIDGDQTAKLREGGTEYPIRVHYQLSERNKNSDIGGVIVANIKGAPIYLRDVAEIVYAQAPNKIERKNRQRYVTVSANLAAGAAMGNVNQEIDATLNNGSMVHIPGTSIDSGGSTKMMQESTVYLVEAIMLALILMYMLMGALFESFLTPFVIMFSLPLALIGAILALLLTGKAVGITAMIGVIMLMGLVSKNAILLLDYTNTMMGRGLARHDALLEAGSTRLRPILMTTLAMVGGMLPTAIALSEGSETRSPLAIAVIGGLIVSTMLTLIIIPVVYTMVDDMWKKIRSLFGAKA